MKLKFFAAVAFSILTSFSFMASADTAINNPSILSITMYSEQGAASVSITVDNNQGGIFLFMNLSVPAQKDMYATLLALRLNNTPVRQIRYDAGSQVTGIAY